MAASGNSIRTAVDLDNLIKEYTYFEKVSDIQHDNSFWRYTALLEETSFISKFITMQWDDTHFVVKEK